MQEYILKQFKATDFKDTHDNTWCSAVFEGVGEPVKWVLKDPSTVKIGETYYGEIKPVTSKQGKIYLRFYREKKPEAKREYVDHHEDIKAEWAIGVALTKMGEMPEIGDDANFQTWLDNTAWVAYNFTKMVDKVKTGDFGREDEVAEVDLSEEVNLDDIPF